LECAYTGYEPVALDGSCGGLLQQDWTRRFDGVHEGNCQDTLSKTWPGCTRLLSLIT
jgi:hypothetical protein